MARLGVVKGGGCGRGMCPLRRKARKFFTGGRYLMDKKCFLSDRWRMDINMLNNPRPHRIRFNCDLCSLSSFCLLSVKDVEVQVLIGLFQVQLGSEILKGLITASHQYLAYQLLVYPTSPNHRSQSASINVGCKTSSELPNTDHADMRRNRILLRMSVQDAI